MFADSGAVDQHTHRVSLFDVVEAFNVFIPQPTEDGQAPVRLRSKQRITAVWMRGEGDTGEDRFESQVACVSPDGAELFYTEPTDFVFTTFFQRFDLLEVQIPGFNALGVHFIEARLRRAGEQGWQWRQSFPFVVQEIAPPAPVPPPENPPA